MQANSPVYIRVYVFVLQVSSLCFRSYKPLEMPHLYVTSINTYNIIQYKHASAMMRSTDLECK